MQRKRGSRDRLGEAVGVLALSVLMIGAGYIFISVAYGTYKEIHFGNSDQTLALSTFHNLQFITLLAQISSSLFLYYFLTYYAALFLLCHRRINEAISIVLRFIAGLPILLTLSALLSLIVQIVEINNWYGSIAIVILIATSLVPTSTILIVETATQSDNTFVGAMTLGVSESFAYKNFVFREIRKQFFLAIGIGVTRGIAESFVLLNLIKTHQLTNLPTSTPSLSDVADLLITNVRVSDNVILIIAILAIALVSKLVFTAGAALLK